MKTAIVTGATGFIGYHLTKKLSALDIFVYAIIRPNSKNKQRLQNLANIKIIELDMVDIKKLSTIITGKFDCFFHIAWDGERNDFIKQYQNVDYTMQALESAKELGCKRFICTGSQAEYGLSENLVTEETIPKPNTAYGAAKVAACYLSKYRAEQFAVEWIWTRIFSVYGKYDNPKALIPYVVDSFKDNKGVNLTACQQKWNYLYIEDAVNALVLLMEQGKAGEIYNIAGHETKVLKEFVEDIKNIIKSNSIINYSTDNRMVVSLNPCIKKIMTDTSWKIKFKFSEGINEIIRDK